jgi:hypothetical protein
MVALRFARNQPHAGYGAFAALALTDSQLNARWHFGVIICANPFGNRAGHYSSLSSSNKSGLIYAPHGA